MMPPDPWLAAAEALAREALAHPGVAALDPGPSFETRGRGHPVRGVALRREAGQAVATVGVILTVGAARSSGIPACADALRTRLRRRWAALETGLPLDVCIYVSDLVLDESPARSHDDDRSPA
ncbi:MAG: hypothetical protein D6746_04030 [Bacteroidetes bacterium]|nr:MAG: hypothetical protein D6746_04030 [Bacteroidota bacterium]